MQLIYHGAIEILDSEFLSFEKVCTELKIEGFPPLHDAGLPVLNLEHVPMESLATSSGLPASSDAGMSSDAGSPIGAPNHGFQFEVGVTSGIGLSNDQVLHTEMPMDLSDPTGLPAEPSNSTGLPAEPSNSTGLPAEPSSPTGLPAEPSSSTGLPAELSSSTRLPERMDEDESDAKRPRLSVSGESPNVFVKVNFC